MNRTTLTSIIIAAAAGSCFAGPVTFKFEGLSQGRNMGIDVGEFSGTVFAGSILHRVDGEALLTYCIDPDQAAQKGVDNFERTQVAKALGHRDYAGEKAAAIAELADNIGASLWTTSANRDVAAAFQISVWEIVMDFNPDAPASFNFQDGEFKASGRQQVFSLASDMLSALSFNRGTAEGYIAYAHETHQDFMGQAIPTPAAIALGAAGLPLMIKRRRR